VRAGGGGRCRIGRDLYFSDPTADLRSAIASGDTTGELGLVFSRGGWRYDEVRPRNISQTGNGRIGSPAGGG